MIYRVSFHPSVQRNLKKLYKIDRQGYEYVKHRLSLLVYKPEIGIPLEAEFQGILRIHIGPYVVIYKFDNNTNILTLLVFEHYTWAYNMYTAYA